MNEELTSLLRRFDPAAGKSLSQPDRARIVRRMLAAPPDLVPRWRLATAAAVIVLALMAVTFAVRSKRRPAVHAPPIQARLQAARIAPSAPRQIQYATPGGTRIVWTLDPNFHM